jgi:formate-dependent nitrite reductase membrane component NrfD
VIELSTTRANPMIDPALHVWGWEIPVYLFLGGLVAGMMAITGWLLLSERFRRTGSAIRILPALAIVLLSLGMFALFLDLELGRHVFRLYLTFEPASPMSWGAWILVAVYPALAAALLVRPPELVAARLPRAAELGRRLAGSREALRWIGTANLLLGGLLGIYTGVLLSSLGARPLWNSALLGPLFLVSGLSTAAAFVHLIAREPFERELLARADNGLLMLELAFLVLFLIGLAGAGAAHARAARLLLDGPYAAGFWVVVVGLGIVVPLVVQSLAVRHRVRSTPVAPLLVVAGGLVLRFLIVDAGQVSHWTAAALR